MNPVRLRWKQHKSHKSQTLPLADEAEVVKQHFEYKINVEKKEDHWQSQGGVVVESLILKSAKPSLHIVIIHTFSVSAAVSD